MLEDALLWIGMVGLIGGIAVGLSLLESEGDPFLRNVMLSAGIACRWIFSLVPDASHSPYFLWHDCLVPGMYMVNVHRSLPLSTESLNVVKESK